MSGSDPGTPDPTKAFQSKDGNIDANVKDLEELKQEVMKHMEEGVSDAQMSVLAPVLKIVRDASGGVLEQVGEQAGPAGMLIQKGYGAPSQARSKRSPRARQRKSSARGWKLPESLCRNHWAIR